MIERENPARLPPICTDCGHRASLHDGRCRALLLGRSAPTRDCGCTTTLRDILRSRTPLPPAEAAEPRAV